MDGKQSFEALISDLGLGGKNIEMFLEHRESWVPFISSIRYDLAELYEIKKRIADQEKQCQRLAQTKYTKNGKERYALGQISGVLDCLIPAEEFMERLGYKK